MFLSYTTLSLLPMPDSSYTAANQRRTSSVQLYFSSFTSSKNIKSRISLELLGWNIVIDTLEGTYYKYQPQNA
jgi:hypothetical protein